MTTRKPLNSPAGADSLEPLSLVEKLEEDAPLAAEAAAGGLHAVEVAGVVLIGLLVCPPLGVLVFVFVVPTVVVALVLGLLAAVISTPYLLIHQFREHDGDHMSLLAHRLRRAARALIDLAPHRIVADARKPDSGR